MKIIKKFLSLALCVILVLSAVPTVHAENEAAVEPYARQMLQYYLNYQDNARTDIARLVQEMGTIDAAQAEAWESIMSYWSQAHSDTFLNNNVLPDGLPEDNSLCIVVLGYALQSDGGMQNELVQRLKVALASAEKYPNAYILCTGGGTASGNRSVTEAGQMAAWLKKNGIDSSRIIVENKSYSTVQNATYSYKILEEDYPQVKHLAIVTSDYHVSWGYMAFATEISLGVYVDMNPYMDIVSNAAYPTKNQKGNLNTECSHITQIAGISFRQSGKPTLSQLTGLNILGNLRYYVGDDLNLTITAEYDNGFSRDVTSEAQISDVEMRLPGTRIIRIQYEENGVAIDTAVEIELLPIPRSGTEPAQETVQLTQISPTAVNRPKKILLPLFLSLLVTFAVGWMMFRHQQKKAKQRRRRKKMYL